MAERRGRATPVPISIGSPQRGGAQLRPEGQEEKDQQRGEHYDQRNAARSHQALELLLKLPHGHADLLS